jgi:putative aldouronate transport system permease protein
MCAIPALLVFVFNYLPMAGIVIAFKNYRYDDGIFGSRWVGFKNFEYFIKSNDFLKITWNTLSLNFLFIVFGLISAVLLAVILYELRSRALTKIYETVLITPHFLSWVVAGYMAYALLNPEYGIVNGFLKSAGLSGISFYTKPEMWPAILTVVSVWKRLGMDCVIYYAALMGVDSSLFEAAEIDGASKIQRTWYILLPSLIPIITIMSILKVGSIFRADFGLFYQLTRNVGALYSTTDVIDTYVFRTMRVVGNMSLSSAVGFMQSIVGFALVVTTNYLSKKIDADSGLF